MDEREECVGVATRRVAALCLRRCEQPTRRFPPHNFSQTICSSPNLCISSFCKSQKRVSQVFGDDLRSVAGRRSRWPFCCPAASAEFRWERRKRQEGPSLSSVRPVTAAQRSEPSSLARVDAGNSGPFFGCLLTSEVLTARRVTRQSRGSMNIASVGARLCLGG